MGQPGLHETDRLGQIAKVSDLRSLVCDYSRLKAIAKGIASFFPEAVANRLLSDLFAEGDGLLLDVSELHGVPTLTRDHVIRLGVRGNVELLTAAFGAAEGDLIAGHLRRLGVDLIA